LILVLCFAALNRTLASAVRYDETDISPEIVLVDLSTNQYFFERHIGTALHHASVLAYYGSEEAIEAGMHLEWYEYRQVLRETYDAYYGNETVWWSVLRTPDGNFNYAHIDDPVQNTQGLREQFEYTAILQQLSEFRAAKEYLKNTAGLLYYISFTSPINSPARSITMWPHENSISNVEEHRRTSDFFSSMPVYYIVTGSNYPEQSFNTDYLSSHLTDYPVYIRPEMSAGGSNTALYLAFTNEAVEYQSYIYSVTRNAYIVDLGIFAASIVLILGLTALLLVGAGRKYKAADAEANRANRVHFSLIDKPYLDISLFALFCWTILIMFLAYRITETMWSHKNVTAMNLLFAAAILLIVPSILLWLMSLAKRVKAGRFWKHTLIYAILFRCLFGLLRLCVRTVKSLWAGTHLALKVSLISFAAFGVMFFIGIIGAMTHGVLHVFAVSLFFTAVIAILLQLYVRRIRSLELGAHNANEGKYDTPIDAGGGELGSIASSINSISAGINTAVEQRLKSERMKTELITNVSHDIRTPLTSIITYTDLLEHEGLNCKRAPEYLDVLKQKSLRLKTLTDELFEAAKAATGNIDVNLTELNIVSLINQVLGELDSTIKSSGLDLRINLPEKLLARADGRLMQRIMENLLSNVFRYSLPGSRVYLDAHPPEDSHVRIEIKNISASELNFDPSELTERFKRGDNSRTDGGSGLGLSIVQSFVDAQGGKFSVSIDGDLFKATVLLPAPPPDASR